MKNDAITAGEGDFAREEELGLDGALPDGPLEPDRVAEEGEEPELFEIEHEGQVFAVPAALKGAFLRHADYTRKTQELAEHRRTVEAERAALAEQHRAVRSEQGDRGHLAALDHQLEAFAGVDWRALAQESPQEAQALWHRYQETQALREQYTYAISHHDERGRLEAAREAAAQMAETGRVLQQEIDGWSPEVAGKLVEYAQAFGVTLEELAQAADPRLWKLLHRAYQADQGAQRETAARAQAVRPAVLVSGAAAGGGGVRDELATKEWMQRRTEQMRKGR